MGVNCSPESDSDTDQAYDGETKTTLPSYAEIYKLHRKQLPYALAMGMTADEFWNGDISLFWAYEKAARIKRKQEDTLAWMQGFYNGRAFADVIAVAFGKKGQQRESVYPKQPVFSDETLAKKKQDKLPSGVDATEDERVRIAEEIKAQFRIVNNSTNAALVQKAGGRQKAE